ncbi:hypothetical protein AMJ85_00025 [candidate division BRC1 bacterium SM23_51]|nr:MAG: hypothetical protein AMJ85_00025 [candidate division BRC1 bacterium SM23_51]
MKRCGSIVLFAIIFAVVGECAAFGADKRPDICGELKKWHKVTVTFSGPETSEEAEPNPFRDYRLNVTFRKGKKQYVVGGYYAADGDAGQSSATEGNKWRVHFVPDETGKWSYTASFRTGPDIALSSDAEAGSATAFDGTRGSFAISPSDKTGRDFRGKGLLKYVGKRYLQFAGTGEYFLKGGADSPENFLAYTDFDGTFDTGELKREGEAAGDKFLHRYQPHVKDFKPGDPTWKSDKGKGIIGALNYLASKGMNSVYFIPYNIDGGDGKDVWPWISPEEKFRFDCSKLDQWEIVFSHMSELGLMLHIITQEQENDQGLDGGELGPQRKLYYRELIARFGHHLGLVWNLGEENTNTDAQRKAFCRYIKDLDPYDHPIVMHTFPGRYDKAYAPLLGYEYFDGPSLQTNDTHEQTVKWIDRSASANRQWVVCLDEIGPAHTGVKPDKDDYWHDEVRKQHLWGNLMAGGAGVEWYFGYKFANNDLNCEDWRSRDHLWDLTRYALEFFHEHLPFTEMSHHDELTTAKDDYCLARPGQIYAIYLPGGGTTHIDLGEDAAAFTVKWYNPRMGGPLRTGTVTEVDGPSSAAIGHPPQDADKDWVALIRKTPK